MICFKLRYKFSNKFVNNIKDMIKYHRHGMENNFKECNKKRHEIFTRASIAFKMKSFGWGFQSKSANGYCGCVLDVIFLCVNVDNILL